MNLLKFFCAIMMIGILGSCSSDPEPATTKKSTPPDDNVSSQPSIELFEIDTNWTNPTETVSQYGPSGIIRDVVIDRAGIVWLAAWDGIVSYDGKEFTNHTLKDGLSHHRVYSVMEDSKGNMWFGTMGAGVYKYDGSKFTNLSMNNGLVHNSVMDMTEDSKGNIWFATIGGVSKYDGAKFMNLNDSNELYNQMYAVAEGENGVMWIGGELGLFQFDPEAAKSKVTEVFTSYETSYSNVRDLLFWNGTMYMGCTSGFYMSEEKGSALSPLTSISKNFTTYIHPSKTSDLLLTSNGIERYNTIIYQPHESPAVRWTTIVDDLSNIGYFGSVEGDDGTIWYGAMDGLHSVKNGKDVSYKKP